MIELNIESAQKFIDDQKRLGADIRWDNYDIILFKPTPKGFTDRRGAFRQQGRNKGRWGIQIRIPVTYRGTWKVHERNVRVG